MKLINTVRYLDDLQALGARIPKVCTDAAAIYETALEAAAWQPTVDLHAALAAGELTRDNIAERVHTTARDLAVQQNAHAVVQSLQNPLNRVIRDGLRKDQDQIVTALRAAWRPAAEKVMEAGRHFTSATTAADVIDQGAERIKLWHSLSENTRTLDRISVAYRHLLADLLRALPEQQVSLFITGKAVDLDHATSLYRANGAWLDLGNAGFELRLNSLTEAEAVVAGHGSARPQKPRHCASASVPSTCAGTCR